MLPKSINVKGVKYRITENLKDNDHLIGQCDRSKKTIRLNPSETKDQKFKIMVLAHELCHAYMHEYNLDKVIEPNLDEQICLMVEDIVKDLVPVIIESRKAIS